MSPAKRNILIVKTGFSEFLDRGVSATVSLGDVLMCTALLHLYRKDHVTWVSSWAARRLLEGNPYIGELLTFGPDFFRLSERAFDEVINLEKDIGICTYLQSITARRRKGFYFNARTHDIATYRRATRYLLAGQENHKGIEKNGLEILYEAVGAKWRGETIMLTPRRRAKVKYDIGFNYEVGKKWPTKAWPLERWRALEKQLGGTHSISWQQGFKNLDRYIAWIDACRLIVTSDSLGQAVAQALGKKVITLFGPTNARRMDGIPGIHTVSARSSCPHLPCYLPFCRHKAFCMETIDPGRVASLCERLLA